MWKSGIRRKTGFVATAGLLEYALQLEVPVTGPPPDHVGVRGLLPGVAGRRNRVDPLSPVPAAVSILFLPRAAPGSRPKLVGNTFASLCALGGLAILLLLGLTPREAVAAAL